jgi:hypothetical protein
MNTELPMMDDTIIPTEPQTETLGKFRCLEPSLIFLSSTCYLISPFIQLSLCSRRQGKNTAFS